MAISSLGTGLVLPFGSIYLHVVRHLAIAVVGAVLSMSALASLLLGVAGGSLVDRVGPRIMMLAGLILQAAGFTVLGFALSWQEAVLAMLLIGAGTGCFYPAFAALVAAITTRTQRSAAAALQYAATNLGIGCGAVVGGVLVAGSSATRFTLIYLLNAASFIAFGVLLALRVPSGHQRPRREATPPSYGAVLHDRVFLALVGFNALVVLSTYAQLDTSVPLYARVFLGVHTVWLGLILAVNTALIVVAQLPLARAVRRLRRSQTLGLSAAAWTVAWLVGELASLGHGAPAAWLLGVYASIFGVGECLLAATIGPLVADLAPAATRGRYMAAFNLSWSAGLLVGPAAGGLVLGSFLRPGMWLLWAAVAAALVGYARWLGRHLPTAVNHPPPGG
ncbi:MAG: MFS transporter [Candidatus Dormibacteria bacterium]